MVTSTEVAQEGLLAPGKMGSRSQGWLPILQRRDEEYEVNLY